MKQNFPTSGLIHVAMPIHRCNPLKTRCLHGSVHIVRLDKQETICCKDCHHWKQFDEDLFELGKKWCQDHLVCLHCQRMLRDYITQAYRPYAVNWNNPSNPIVWPKKIIEVSKV